MSIVHHRNTAGFRLLYAGREFARRIAITGYDDCRRRRFTYSELLALTIQTAGLLLDRGCRKGDTLMVCAENSVEYALLVFAAAVLGLRLVPVDFNSAPEAIDNYCAASSPRLLCSSRAELLERHAGDGPAPLEIDLLLEEIAPYPSALDQLTDRWPEANWYVGENDPYLLIFTSGTTSEPKAVPLTHRNLTSNITAFRQLCFIPEDHQMLSMAPLSHVLGLTMGLYCVLSFGASVVYIRRLDSATIMRVMREDRIDVVLTVPAFLNILKDKIEEQLEARGKLAAVRRMIPRMLKLPIWARRLVFRKLLAGLGGDLKWIATGASPLNPEVGNFYEALGIMVCQGYGLTECAIVSVSDFAWRRMGTVGRPLPNLEVRLDEHDEIWVAGPHLFAGYEGHPELNEEIFDGGWYRTGDIGKIDEDGHLSIIGRTKNVIIGPSGLNIYPEDLEIVIAAENDVQECMVVNLPAREDELYLVALIVPSSHARDSFDPDALLARVNARLASHQQLARVRIWPEDDFPRTPSKKIKRAVVLAEIEGRDAPADEDAAAVTGTATEPESSFEARVMELIARARKIAPAKIGPSDRLISDLGFDSLGLAELVVVLQEQLGVVSARDDLFNRDLTVSEFAELVEPGDRALAARPGLEISTPGRGVRAINRAIARTLLAPLYRSWFQMRIEGRKILRREIAPAIKREGHLIVANHASHLDGLSIFAALPHGARKRLVAAVAHDYFFADGAWRRNFMITSHLRVLPVRRSADPREYFLAVGRALDAGDSVLIFPEGTRSRSGELGEFRPSVGQLIRGMRAPVVPVFIHGTHALWPPDQARPRRGSIRLRFAEPIRFSGQSTAYEIRDRLHDLYRSELSQEGGRP